MRYRNYAFRKEIARCWIDCPHAELTGRPKNGTGVNGRQPAFVQSDVYDQVVLLSTATKVPITLAQLDTSRVHSFTGSPFIRGIQVA